MLKSRIKKYFTLFVFSFVSVMAQEIKIPTGTQLELISKIIAFDNNFNERIKDKKNIKIGIIYSEFVKNSFRIKQEISEIFGKQNFSVRNNILKCEFIELADYLDKIKNNNYYAVYITPMRGVNIDKILKACKENAVLSITGIDEYFENGVSIFFDLVNNYPKIHINLDSTKEEGCNLSSYLLRIAKIKK